MLFSKKDKEGYAKLDERFGKKKGTFEKRAREGVGALERAHRIKPSSKRINTYIMEIELNYKDGTSKRRRVVEEGGTQAEAKKKALKHYKEKGAGIRLISIRVSGG